jgi:hypothetical protein
MWELIKHGYCLLVGHKDSKTIIYTRDGVTWAYHRCARCNYPVPVKNIFLEE